MSCHQYCNQGRHCDGLCEPRVETLPLTRWEWVAVIAFGVLMGVLLAWRG